MNLDWINAIQQNRHLLGSVCIRSSDSCIIGKEVEAILVCKSYYSTWLLFKGTTGYRKDYSDNNFNPIDWYKFGNTSKLLYERPLNTTTNDKFVSNTCPFKIKVLNKSEEEIRDILNGKIN